MERCSISIKGVKQGQFKGELPNLKQRDDWMAALRFSMAVSVPHNELTGMATGRRKHTPIKITKEWGAASPQILQALAVAEVLNPVILEFTRTNPNGEEMVFQRVTLANAIVSDVTRSHETGATGAGADHLDLEEISFTFQKITVEDIMGKTSFVDDWLAPEGS